MKKYSPIDQMLDPDKAFWVAVRAALLAVIAAIERRWGIG